MIPDWRIVLRQLARTTALVAVLGLLLWGVVVALADTPAGTWIITLALAAPLAALQGLVAWEGLRTGELAVWLRTVRRAEEPRAYWGYLAWQALVTLGLLMLAGWACLEGLGLWPRALTPP